MARPSLRDEHRQLTLARIIDAARRLFFGSGYASTSMEEIAREAGISRTTLYQYYSSKTAIMDAILDVEVPRFTCILKTMPQAVLDRAQIERLLRAMQQHYRDNAEFVAILRQAVASEESIASRIDHSFRSVIELLIRHLPQGTGERSRGQDVTRTRLHICLSAADSMLERCMHAEWANDRELVLRELAALWCSMFDIPGSSE